MKPIIRKVVGEIQALLEKQPNTASTIYNIYGITGIGKSYILRTPLDNQPALLVNFDTDKPMDGEQSSSFADALADALKEVQGIDPEFLDTGVPDFKVYTRRVGNPSQPPRLILLDGVDDVPYWKEIQRRLIKPLTTPEGAPISVIVASQSPIFWHYWELREMVKLIPITPFGPDETRQFLEENYPSYAGLSEGFHNFTGGYPAALEELLTITKEEQARASDISVEGTSETIDSGLSDADQASLKAAIAEYKELGWIGLLRRTDPVSLEIVLHKSDPDDERWREKPKPGFNEQIHMLRQQLWDAGYSLPLSPQQRAWLKEHQQKQAPETYRQVLGALVTHYEDLIINRVFPQLHRDIFNEWLYLHLCLKKVPEASNRVWVNLAITRDTLIQDVGKDTELLDLMGRSSDRTAYIAVLPKLRNRLEPFSISPETQQAYSKRLTERLDRALGSRPELELSAVLRAAYEAEKKAREAEGEPDGFKLTDLQKQLPSPKPGVIGDLVLILNSRSFILYEAQSQRFSLNSVLRAFVRAMPPNEEMLPEVKTLGLDERSITTR